MLRLRPRISAAVLAGALGCVSCKSSCGGDVAPASASARASAAPSAGQLPPAARVFAFPTKSGAVVIGGSGTSLWCADASGRVLWTTDVPSPLELAAAGDFGRGEHAYVALGPNEKQRPSEMILDEVDLGTGALHELWRTGTRRNEAVHLEITDPEGDGRRAIALAYFADTHTVASVAIGADLVPASRASIRMATSRAYADVDGDGVVDEIIGRLYGDAPTEVGGLRVRTARGTFDVPVDRGVRALTAIASKTGAADVVVADGWVADYGHEARAELERVHWDGQAFAVRRIASSADEFAFFDIVAVPSAGPPSDVLAIGNRRISQFRLDGDEADTPVASRAWPTPDGFGTVAVGSSAEGAVVYLTGRGATQAIRLADLADH